MYASSSSSMPGLLWHFGDEWKLNRGLDHWWWMAVLMWLTMQGTCFPPSLKSAADTMDKLTAANGSLSSVTVLFALFAVCQCIENNTGQCTQNNTVPSAVKTTQDTSGSSCRQRGDCWYIKRVTALSKQAPLYCTLETMDNWDGSTLAFHLLVTNLQ